MSEERKWIASDGSELKPGMMVLGRDADRWTVDIFSHIESDCPHEFVCSGGNVYTKCIPFEGNEHMAGTKLPTPQKDKQFEWGEKVLVWNDDGEEKTLALFLRKLEDVYGVVTKEVTFEHFWRHCTRAPLDTTDD